jgi:hypothetical protein
MDMRRNCCEFNEGKKRRFIEVYSCDFRVEVYNYYKKIDCLEESLLFKFLSSLNVPVPDYDCTLFQLKTYIGEIGIDDLWEFSKKITDYEEIGFCSQESLLEYCYSRWNITEDDFSNIESTNIPTS